jgi:hypothetical protein
MQRFLMLVLAAVTLAGCASADRLAGCADEARKPINGRAGAITVNGQTGQ